MKKTAKTFDADDATRFLGRIKRSKDKYIRGFNAVVGKGRTATYEWSRAEGALIRSEGVGARLVGKLKYGGKVFKVFLIGTFVYAAAEEGLAQAIDDTGRSMLFIDEVQNVSDSLIFDKLGSYETEVRAGTKRARTADDAFTSGVARHNAELKASLDALENLHSGNDAKAVMDDLITKMNEYRQDYEQRR